MTANVRIVTDTRESVLKVPNAALRFRPPDFQEPPPGPALGRALRGELAAAAAALLASAHAQPAGARAAQPAGAGAAQLRERLERELALTDAQKQQLDAILAGMRPKFAEARNAPEAERTRISERNRAELRERITEILTPQQRERYNEIAAQGAGRPQARGRVFVLGAERRPRPVQVRAGITDGSFTEIADGELAEGDEVIIGVAGNAAATARPATTPGPRLPF